MIELILLRTGLIRENPYAKVSCITTKDLFVKRYGIFGDKNKEDVFCSLTNICPCCKGRDYSQDTTRRLKEEHDQDDIRRLHEKHAHERNQHNEAIYGDAQPPQARQWISNLSNQSAM